MRVALFFDGKNHMKALRRSAEDRWLNHGALARWTVEQVGGDTLFAAYYYTGVPGPQDDSDRHALTDPTRRAGASAGVLRQALQPARELTRLPALSQRHRVHRREDGRYVARGGHDHARRE